MLTLAVEQRAQKCQVFQRLALSLTLHTLKQLITCRESETCQTFQTYQAYQPFHPKELSGISEALVLLALVDL
jgi:hypothetical protein